MSSTAVQSVADTADKVSSAAKTTESVASKAAAVEGSSSSVKAAATKTAETAKTVSDTADKVSASAAKVKSSTSSTGAAATTTTPATRGRSINQESAVDASAKSRSRSKSMSRKAKKAGSKLRGMVKSGMKSLRGISGGASTSSRQSTNDDGINSRDSSMNGPNSLAGAEIDVVSSSKGMATSTTSASSSSVSSSLELVVLLMDPTTRRFELLQLEFDSPKAKVSDLLTQIPNSVTEPALKQVEFVGVLDHTGNLQEGSTRLKEAFGDSKVTSTTPTTKIVVVAKPKGVSPKETMRLARPILTDKQVSKMLTSTGFDVTGWKSMKKTSSSTMKGKKSSVTGGSSTTARSGPVVPPATSSSTEPRAEAEPSTDDKEETVQNSWTAIALLVMVVVLICLQLVHNVWTRPIPSNVTLPIGTYKSKCGVVGLVPISVRTGIFETLESLGMESPPPVLLCENAYLYVSSEVTKVTASLYNADGLVDIRMTGLSCKDTGASEDCVDGLVLNSSTKRFEMGDQPIISATVFKNEGKSVSPKQILSPWPFEAVPERQKFKVKSVMGTVENIDY